MRMELRALPEDFARTRDSLHQLAFYVISPARYLITGRMGLVSVAPGFGTPPIDGRTICVDGDRIVDRQGDQSASRPITTLGDAAEFVGIEYDETWFTDFHDPLAPVGVTTPLDVSPDSSLCIGALFAFAWDVLAEVKGRVGDSGAPSDTQLWPEHFDAATEIGDEAAGERASFGVSLGDGGHSEPYLYVSPWNKERARGDFWNDASFGGASLTYGRLLSASDPAREAVEFFATGAASLAGSS
jgi:hypothetical protein